jgi:hypothetical protein
MPVMKQVARIFATLLLGTGAMLGCWREPGDQSHHA